MKLFKFREQTGVRIALSPDHNPDLPSGAWLAIGKINVELEASSLIGADADEIIDAIDREGVFVWPVGDA